MFHLLSNIDRIAKADQGAGAFENRDQLEIET